MDPMLIVIFISIAFIVIPLISGNRIKNVLTAMRVSDAATSRRARFFCGIHKHEIKDVIFDNTCTCHLTANHTFSLPENFQIFIHLLRTGEYREFEVGFKWSLLIILCEQVRAMEDPNQQNAALSLILAGKNVFEREDEEGSTAVTEVERILRERR